MTKEITKAFILQEMQDKLKLRELIPDIFSFSEMVIPTYDIEQHLKKLTRKTSTQSVTATGGKVFFVVPADEQWYLERYNVILMTGVYTVAGVLIGRPASAQYTYLDLTAAQSVSYANDLPKPVKLESGDGLYVNIDGYTSTGDLCLIMEAIVETIR